MGTTNLMSNGISRTLIGIAAIGAVLAITPALASAADSDSGIKAEQTIADFNLEKCKAIDVNIYRCPAVDKPICTSDYSGTDKCIRTDKKGRVIIQGPAPEY